MTGIVLIISTPTMEDGASREDAEVEIVASFPFPFFTGGGLEDSDFLFLYFISLLGSNLISAAMIKEKYDDQIKIRYRKIQKKSNDRVILRGCD